MVASTRSPISSRRSSQLPSASVYGAYWAKTLMVCLPEGAMVASYALWK